MTDTRGSKRGSGIHSGHAGRDNDDDLGPAESEIGNVSSESDTMKNTNLVLIRKREILLVFKFNGGLRIPDVVPRDAVNDPCGYPLSG